jgi:hypothetical protein
MDRKRWLWEQVEEMKCPSCGSVTLMIPTPDGWECTNGCKFSPEGELISGTRNMEKKNYRKNLKADVVDAFSRMEVKREHLKSIKVGKSGKYITVETEFPGILIGPGGCNVKGAGEILGRQIKVMKSK